MSRWNRKVELYDVEKMLHFKSLVERNILPMMGCFRFNATNIIAENINGQIQRFVTIMHLCTKDNTNNHDDYFFNFSVLDRKNKPYICIVVLCSHGQDKCGQNGSLNPLQIVPHKAKQKCKSLYQNEFLLIFVIPIAFSLVEDCIL